MKSPQVWSVVFAGALLFSACGSSESTEAGGDGADTDDAEIEYVSPLGDFLGWTQGADFDEEAAQAEWAEKDREVQEAVAACMTAEGFEYVPIDVSAQNAFYEQQEDLEWGSGEWTAKYGFGVSTQRFSQQKVGPDLVGYTWNDGSAGEQPADPNQEYVESLADNERDAYSEALYGGDDSYPVPIWEEEGREPTDEEMEAFDQEWQDNYVPTGCEPVAYEEIYNDGNGQEQYETFDAEFGEAMVEMEERMESHPDVIAFRAEVRACVEESGAEYLSDNEAYEYFEAELAAAGLSWEDEEDPFADLDTSGFTDEDFQRVYEEFEQQPMAPEKLAALAEVQAAEIAAAVALRECGGGWNNEAEALQDVRIELEEEFLAANADRLAEFEGVFGS